MTKAEFKSKAEAAFMRQNPTAMITGWTQEPKLVKYPTGVVEWKGSFYVVADGYKPKNVLATGDDSYIMCR